MRSMLWTIPVVAAIVRAQITVTASVCNSYSYTDTITFIEYGTIYAGENNTMSISSTTSTTASVVTTMFSVSDSGLLTSRSTATSSIMTSSSTTMRTGTDDVPGNGTSILIPGQDTIAPTTPIPTTSVSTSTTLSSTSTMASTAPSATNGPFYVVFNVRESRKVRKRAIEYLAFNNDSRSVLMTTETNAIVFLLDTDGSLMTNHHPPQYVAIDDSQPPQLFLQSTKPDPRVTVSVSSNGTVNIQGVQGYCALPDGDLVVSTGGRFPSNCQSVMPELVQSSASSTSVTTTVTVASAKMTTTSAISYSSSTRSTTIELTTATSTSSSISMMTSSQMASATPDGTSSSTDISTSSTDSATQTSDTSSTSSDSLSATLSITNQFSTPSTSLSTTTNEDTAVTTTSRSISSSSPIVTDQAYIDTVIRHHNYHRTNHSAPPLSWSDNLASSAKDIAENCIYAHNTSVDGGGYGQNIGAGYLSVQMGYLISDGFYNGEVNSYTYYGEEPDYNTLHSWGHFSQIVWVNTAQVGCYTNNCTASGLGNVDPSTGIRPFFTVCNYGPPGNYVGEFAQNVLTPVGLPTIHADFECPSDENCVDGSI